MASRVHFGLSVASALMVLLLGFLSVCPAAHAYFHAEGPAHDLDCDHHCVVTAFASGEAWYLPPAPLPAPDRRAGELVAATSAAPALAPAAERLLPACGPPV